MKSQVIYLFPFLNWKAHIAKLSCSCSPRHQVTEKMEVVRGSQLSNFSVFVEFNCTLVLSPSNSPPNIFSEQREVMFHISFFSAALTLLQVRWFNRRAGKLQPLALGKESLGFGAVAGNCSSCQRGIEKSLGLSTEIPHWVREKSSLAGEKESLQHSQAGCQDSVEHEGDK